jgi:hypothetical protein
MPKWALVDARGGRKRLIKIFTDEEQALIFQSREFPDVPQVKVVPFTDALREGFRAITEEEVSKGGLGFLDTLADAGREMQSAPITQRPEPPEGDDLLSSLQRGGKRMEELDIGEVLNSNTLQPPDLGDLPKNMNKEMKKILGGG